MLKRLPLLKILTIISYCIVIISGEKISVFMIMYLLLTLFNSGIIGFIISITALSSIMYLFVSTLGRYTTKKDSIFSLASIAILFIPFFILFSTEDFLTTSNIAALLTFLTFVILSLFTAGLLLFKLVNSRK